MEEKIKNLINQALKNLQIEDSDFSVEHPEDLNNGDYSTNVAMVLAKKAKNNPKSLGENIKTELEKILPKEIERVEIAGAGFINFYLSRPFFSEKLSNILLDRDFGGSTILGGKNIMVEYTDPNPFKPFHIGHLMTNAIGESLARIFEYSGAKVSRANYQGDVGLHVAKALFGMHMKGIKKDISSLPSEQARYIGEAYAFGNTAYEEDPEAKKQIDILNQKIYNKSDEQVNEVYTWGFEATMKAFEEIYSILGTKFDYYFLESEMAPFGVEIVNKNIPEVFEESDNAIVFKAEKYDPKLHTRVFITAQGLPTYETKELGLTEQKFKVNPNMDLSVVITANEQAEYMKVVAKAISLIHPDYASKMLHITHGMMRLATGKMGSRKGNVVTGESLIRDTIGIIKEKLKEREWEESEKDKVAEMVGVAAMKYSILRSKAGSDIVFNFEESISVDGDSGPYLQYSYARASSVLEKAKKENILPDTSKQPEKVLDLEKLLYRFPEVVTRSAQTHEPHHIAGYLIELAREFNSFYGNEVIVDKNDSTSPYKIALTFAFSFVMQKGLHLLGIEAPKKM